MHKKIEASVLEKLAYLVIPLFVSPSCFVYVTYVPYVANRRLWVE